MCEAHDIMSVTLYIVNGQEYAVKIPVNIVESSKEKRDKEKRRVKTKQFSHALFSWIYISGAVVASAS